MKLKKVLAILLIGLTLAGCGEGNNPSEYKIQNISPNMVQVGTQPYYYYMVDKNTGVVYLEYTAGYHCAMTVMFNADGSVVTAEQLGLEY